MACKYCFEKDKGTDEMDIEKLNDYMSHNPCITTFPFGGEPLLRMDLLCSIIDSINNNPNVEKERKVQITKKNLNVITNGTLFTDANIEIFKKYGYTAQLSIDGPKHVQDINRIFANGKGSYDKIMEGLEKLIKEGIPWSMHGVVNKETLPYICDIAIWFFETYRKYKDVKTATDHMGKNTFQIIFEEDYTDEDIDILIREYHKFAEWIYTRDYLSIKEKNTLFEKFFLKNGGVCSAGATLLAVDHEFDIYPCHRTAMIPEKKDLLLGNAFEPFGLSNYRLYNSFYNLARLKRYIYSAVTNIDNFNDPEKNKFRWFMWCPSTNWQTSGTVYYQNAKYNVAFTELNRAIQALKEAYYIKEKQDTCKDCGKRRELHTSVRRQRNNRQDK
jgi:sulfatase maturation enzyme AslB (radical SAM superfamily)